jgi:hypothetical protein
MNAEKIALSYGTSMSPYSPMFLIPPFPQPTPEALLLGNEVAYSERSALYHNFLDKIPFAEIV